MPAPVSRPSTLAQGSRVNAPKFRVRLEKPVLRHQEQTLGRPLADLGDDVGTNLLVWLLDAYDDALNGDDGV